MVDKDHLRSVLDVLDKQSLASVCLCESVNYSVREYTLMGTGGTKKTEQANITGFACVRACLLVYHLIVERVNKEQSTRTRAHQYNSPPIKPLLQSALTNNQVVNKDRRN